LHKISSLYAPSEIASQFPPPLRSNYSMTSPPTTAVINQRICLDTCAILVGNSRGLGNLCDSHITVIGLSIYYMKAFFGRS
jgi:hypothetical protein